MIKLTEKLNIYIHTGSKVFNTLKTCMSFKQEIRRKVQYTIASNSFNDNS